MKKLIIYFTILLFACASCDGFLEQEPGTQTSIDEIFADYNGFKMALNGCYYDLEAVMVGERNGVYADALGGNLVFTPSQTNYGVSVPINIENVYSFADNADDSDMDGLYNDFYDIINQANQILERLPGLTDATDDQVSQLKAETLCMRGYSHFCLARYFAQNYSYTADASHPGIICNTRVQNAGEDYPERNTVKETYDIIIEDLQNAMESFKSETVLEGPAYSYFTANSCKALLARVALYAENYQLAIDNADDVIENSGIALLTKEEYVSEWEKPNAPVSEIIMELSVRIDNEGEVKTENTLAGHYAVVLEDEEVKDYEEYCASIDLLNMYEEGDVRSRDMFTSVTLKSIVEEETIYSNYYFTDKFQDNPGCPMLRMSEMYLVKAEAHARLNEVENAVLALNTLREERGAALAQVSDDVLAEIFNERRKELCFEGHLFFDIARFHEDVRRVYGCISTTCNLDYPSNYFVLPIPEKNTELNSNLKQNEGYN